MYNAAPPPLPKPKRRNTYVRLYDAPLHRDWAAWVTLAMAVVTPLALTTGKRSDTGWPRWADGVFGTITFVMLFGLLPAFVRLQLRRRRWRRAQPPSENADVLSSPAVPVPIAVPANRPTPKPSPHDRTPSRVTPIERQAPLAHSSVLLAARHESQYPIARAARAIQLASNKRDEYETVLVAGEAIAITVGASVAAALREQVSGTPEFDALHRAYLGRGVAQGQWIEVLRGAFRVLRDLPEPIPGLLSALRPGPKNSGLAADLTVMLEERNRWAHSAGPRTDNDAAMRIEAMAPALENAFERALFLSDSPWVVVKSASLRRGTQDFAIVAGNAMSDHPDFGRGDFISSVPLANDTVYMLAPAGPIDLTPFVVMHDCPECRQPEMCHADRLDPKNGVALKSFARGHAMFEPELAEDVRSLFNAA